MSVLFADLVGFTNLSESRDAEEVRELLSRYFDTCRRLIELYGGTVEKFIGDAVMAVWGTPTATEDDAERAVRAALDLVASVSSLGDEVGAPHLRARAGVLTGEAAVTLGATGEGMVAGDLVNTASRVQSMAEPGSVFVGESTRRATEQTIVFEDMGSFELKGKEGLTPLWKALRVVSGVRGTLKSQGLEAPFVGRERELRQIKDFFHTSADERKAHLVSVTGIAGIGKSRLAWEFYKYFDGITQPVYWHRGRCLSYGEGVTYWALADMVRMRCRITEDEDSASALGKLRSTLDEHLLDTEERRFVEPRLAQLLGLGEHEGRDRQDLFAAWRLFFERLADQYPTVLAFEDMQWADGSLLDFVEYLLEWSRNHPLYVITLARPELLERRPGWGAGHRNFTSLYLEPLSETAMGELLDGLVPGLPHTLREQILARAEGVPLYAVETVRMLLDRGALVQEGSVYRPLGEISSLEVPETLHALIAARLDGLTPQERRVLQDGAVLGKTFTQVGLASLSDDRDADLEPLLTALVRKEVLSRQADPRSPEHGQYGFLQDLVRHVAYETLSKRDRRVKHLAAATYLSASLGEDEVIEVVASHYLAAYRGRARYGRRTRDQGSGEAALTQAGERAASLAAAAEAQHYFEQAAELSEDTLAEAALTDAAHLVWAVNLGNIDLNPWPVRRSDLDHPDELRIDLDPQPGVDVVRSPRGGACATTSSTSTGCVGWPKTQRLARHPRLRPHRAEWSFTEVRRAALALAREVERRMPDARRRRGGRRSASASSSTTTRTRATARSPRLLGPGGARRAGLVPAALGRGGRRRARRPAPGHGARAPARGRRPVARRSTTSTARSMRCSTSRAATRRRASATRRGRRTSPRSRASPSACSRAARGATASPLARSRSPRAGPRRPAWAPRGAPSLCTKRWRAWW